MTRPHVAVGSLGGTITMTSSTGDTGALPTLGSDDLVAAVPGLDTVAELTTHTLATLPSASLSIDHVFGALDWAHDAVDAGADGVVLVQGTDTLEETAYLLDLYWRGERPLVLTGAMRTPQAAGADGPANLLAAVHTAASRESVGLGVLVVMNDEVHAATRVRKTDSTAVNAFASPPFGPLARLREGTVVYGNRPPRHAPLCQPDTTQWPTVALLETHLGDCGELLRLAVGAGYSGVVLGGFGVGHVPEPVAVEVSAAVDRVPVVLATRTGSGSVSANTYGFVGSETDLRARGAVSAGWLDPRKARTLLAGLLAAGADRDEVHRQFALRGASGWGSVHDA